MFLTGPFLLTHLLLEDLKKTGKENGDSRIVMVSSSLHDVNERMNRGCKFVNGDPGVQLYISHSLVQDTHSSYTYNTLMYSCRYYTV